MCKYDYQCKLCGFKIDVKAEYKDMQDVVLKVSSDCPNLNPVTKEPIVLDAMYELMVPKEKSAVMQLREFHNYNFYDETKEYILRR
jgi:hypothetical protein